MKKYVNPVITSKKIKIKLPIGTCIEKSKENIFVIAKAIISDRTIPQNVNKLLYSFIITPLIFDVLFIEYIITPKSLFVNRL